MRLFVALSLPDHAAAALAELCRGVPGLRPVAAENLHITLVFLGAADPDRAEGVCAALADIRFDPIPIAVRGMGYFRQGRRRMTALWAGVAPDPGLVTLQRRVQAAARAVGFDPERRKFKPHITLARNRQAAPDRLERVIVAHHDLALPPWMAADFCLYRSHLRADGAQYEVLVRFPATA